MYQVVLIKLIWIIVVTSILVERVKHLLGLPGTSTLDVNRIIVQTNESRLKFLILVQIH